MPGILKSLLRKVKKDKFSVGDFLLEEWPLNSHTSPEQTICIRSIYEIIDVRNVKKDYRLEYVLKIVTTTSMHRERLQNTIIDVPDIELEENNKITRLTKQQAIEELLNL